MASSRQKKTQHRKKKNKIKSVRTPSNVLMSIADGSSITVDIGPEISRELTAHKCWTDECTRLLKSSGRALFLYDRMESAVNRAYGSSKHKILLNPVLVMCYHPECLSRRRTVRLQYFLNFKRYLEHLLDHDDEIGMAMYTRFETITEYPFTTAEDLDKISISPHSLQQHLKLSKQSKDVVRSYGINRKLKVNYICHWKDVLIRERIINSSNLTFQEDDALISSVLHFPNPVSDWSIYDTLSFYCLKFIAGVGEPGLNLFHGKTHQRLSTANDPSDLFKMVSDMNHPGPSLTTLQNVLPQLIHANKTRYRKENIFHLKLLEKVNEPTVIEFPMIRRYPATLGIDEQELNSGVYVHNGMLHGLETPMTPQEIMAIGLKNLASHIAEKNHFINAAREYRLTDLKGVFCSNVFTWFISETLKHYQVIDDLKGVVRLASCCLHCLKNNKECIYENIDKRCTECSQSEENCISMFVVVVLWDMGSSHKKAANEMPSLSAVSCVENMYRRDLFSFIFGGLHLCKACINCSRNHVLSYNGQNYGVNILRQLKHQFEELFEGIKTAIVVGKDRQSDNLSYSTCDERIQGLLKDLKTYQITRVPEDILSYTQKAKTQKDIISPIAVAANKNGDVFVLDSSGACIHVVDRSSVAKVTILGTYKSDDIRPYKKKTTAGTKVKDIMLSTGVTDLIHANDNIFVSDWVRNEVAVICNCVSAGSINSCRLRMMIIDKCISLCFVEQNLVVLRKDCESSIIEILELENLDKGTSFFLSYQKIASLRSNDGLKSLFCLSLNYFGSHMDNKSISIFHYVNGEISKIHSESSFSQSRPWFSDQMNLIFTVGIESSSHLSGSSIEFLSGGVTMKNVKKIPCNLAPLVVCTWGETTFMICNRGSNDFVLVEMGSLEFGVLFCRSVHNLYKAVSYIPPHGDNTIRSMKLSECIDLAVESVELFNKMQISLQERFPGRLSFAGANGVIWSQTLKCINSSIESLKVVEKRLKHLSNGADVSVYCHALFNESYIEHSFGSQTQKGQGQLQNKQEYCVSKRRHQVNFQIKMCNTPFNQYTKVKKRDQGYQALGERELQLSIRDMKDIFSGFDDEKPTEVKLSDGEMKVLKHSFNLAKSVPRQSNRCKWREKSGFSPNMLQPKTLNSGKLYVGDLVFFQSFGDKVLNLLIIEEVVLCSIDIPIKVQILQSEDQQKVYTIYLNQLLQDNGQTVVVPSDFFSIEDGEFRIQENVSYLFDKLTNKGCMVQKDSEWDPLFDDFCKAAESVDVLQEASKNSQKEKPKKRKSTQKITDKSKISKNSQKEKPKKRKSTQKIKDKSKKRKSTQKADKASCSKKHQDISEIVDRTDQAGNTNSSDDDIDFACNKRSKKLRVVYSDEESDDKDDGNDDDLD